MDPEKGDRGVIVRRGDVAAGFRDVGVVEGDTLMFHSALSSLGMVDGGADAAIDGMLDAVGAGGTVAAPTLCHMKDDEGRSAFETWDIETSPSYVGKISETLRLRGDAVRSDHPTHSVAAIGGRAAELTAGHGASGERPGPFNSKAFAGESPWQKFRDWNAAYCFIGVTFRVNTMVHYVETMVLQHDLERFGKAERARRVAEVQCPERDGVWPSIRVADRERHEAAMAERGLVRYGKIGSATVRMARAGEMVDAWLEMVLEKPERWLPKEYMEWLG